MCIGGEAQWWRDHCAPIMPPALWEWSRLRMQSAVRFPASWRIDTPRGAVARLLPTSDNGHYVNLAARGSAAPFWGTRAGRLEAPCRCPEAKAAGHRGTGEG